MCVILIKQNACNIRGNTHLNISGILNVDEITGEVSGLLRRLCSKLSHSIQQYVLDTDIDLKLRNKLHGPMHYKIGVTCVYNGHEVFPCI